MGRIFQKVYLPPTPSPHTHTQTWFTIFHHKELSGKSAPTVTSALITLTRQSITAIEHSTWYLVNAQWDRHVLKAPGDDRIKSKLLCIGHAQSSFWFVPLPAQPCLLPHGPRPPYISSSKSAITCLSGLHVCLGCLLSASLLTNFSFFKSQVLSSLRSLPWCFQANSVKSCTEAILFSFLTGCTKIKDRDFTLQMFSFPVLNAVPNAERAVRKDWLDE